MKREHKMTVQTLPPQLKDQGVVGKSPFHLTEEQVKFFDDNGFLILRKWITGKLLERLQAAGTQWIDQGLELQKSGVEILGTDQDYNFAKRPNGKVLFRVNYLHNKGNSASLELLGSPQVLSVAESLSGRNFVPTYESMVFKMPGDGEAIPWHQDAVFPRNFRVYNFDLYLDRSVKGAGALHVIPKSHKNIHDVCEIAETFEWEHPDMIVVEMEPGDVLIHDDMVLHGSPRTLGSALRRTIYFEFRSYEQITTEGPWDLEWIHKRMRLVPIALDTNKNQYPGPYFDWEPTPDAVPFMTDDIDAELKVVHGVHTSGSYCSAGSSKIPELSTK